MNTAILNLRIAHVLKRAQRQDKEAMLQARQHIVRFLMAAGKTFNEAAIAVTNFLRGIAAV